MTEDVDPLVVMAKEQHRTLRKALISAEEFLDGCE
jgi:hypothetical protein